MNRFLGVCEAVSVLSLSLSVLAPSCKVVRRCWCVFLLESLRNNRKTNVFVSSFSPSSCHPPGSFTFWLF